MKTISNFLLSSLIILSVAGCARNKHSDVDGILIENTPYIENEINQLKIQLSEIEDLINKNKKRSRYKLEDNSSPIKSITLRIGSNDDRLRIYWKDGSKTDLPCTKEQLTWACG